MTVTEEPAEQAVLMYGLRTTSKRSRSRLAAGILLALVHLLLELLGFLFVYEAQAGQALLDLKRVEEGAVLVVVPGIEDFLIPDNAAIRIL